MSETESQVRRPVRTTEDWDCERVDGDPNVTIQRPRRPRNRIDEFLFDLFDTPTERELELDAVGSIVWRHCDGETTTAAIADELAARVPDERIEPVDETLSYFLAQLAELDLIRYPAD
ncbi:PqqD family protein [Halococcus thailandensis]|uniref:Coenzyme PQQ synthesis protein D (PqqD) n=1 Tax=Halococcus thailandensis JCM 13552 TaxID=1227457 RepID=M0MVE6_9EURY|nr:PqqD family protein [Halococcus thailandensis]EMA49722.1 hypothetical protein C451_19338 [Halococcus thailandensis JCM 13552]